jgi:hypothetical protein
MHLLAFIKRLFKKPAPKVMRRKMICVCGKFITIRKNGQPYKHKCCGKRIDASEITAGTISDDRLVDSPIYTSGESAGPSIKLEGSMAENK